MTGTVYLVGAGPGDPGLLTVRAAELLARADVLVYDALASPGIVELATRAERIFAGKRGGRKNVLSQDEISALLVDLARKHETVVRLKGGDPFVFGRGGEEALELARAGIPFEVVPGVTAGVAAPAYAGIPVTHRGLSTSVTLVTGHEDPTKAETEVDWEFLARGTGTLVFYMSVGRMEENFGRLIAAGRSPDTPAAAVEWGTYPRQRTVMGTMATLPEIARAANIGAPSIVLVGNVVSLRDELAWFDRRPLSGRCIVVTRARAQASEFAATLERLGAEVLQLPVIRIVPPADPAPLREAAARAETFDWIVFTSVNGVEHFFRELAGMGRDARALGAARVCAIGPATAAEAAKHGIRADLVPDEFVAEAAVEALAAAGVDGKRILLPRAEIARAVLPDGLRARGAEVVEVVAYRTVQDGAGADEVRRRLDAGEVDLVTFTASSTVRNFASLVGADVGRAKVASIGPVTSQTVREMGMAVEVEAAEYTIPGLVEAIRGFYAESAG
ncbi:uroporphyrinogen-III C-methyltransferase [Longimicrobium sp.]|uniref:uroporphyrinogen-III C-methyltransferase n=1 Tax=Longimicrobium sp. TaxID=2029185 RepID=UPI002D189AF9|nr:uroporphyrinogen-III C-methyltransferase [Longimicrobium sp.]HSU17108.1 uroporphyrinogen-III C-methyltransferase [Longimicrobium sp.]